MILKIMAVRDRAVDAFGQPFFVTAIGQAVRSFKDEVNNAGSSIGNHPDDYDLYHIGDYDDSVGAVSAILPPAMVAVGKSLVNTKE